MSEIKLLSDDELKDIIDGCVDGVYPTTQETAMANELIAVRARIKRLESENITMLNLLTDISENHYEFFNESEGYMYAEIPLDYVSEINSYVGRDVDAENPFKVTDEVINEIKVKGIEELIKLISNEDRFGFEGMAAVGKDTVILEIKSFARELRKKATNHD